MKPLKFFLLLSFIWIFSYSQDEWTQIHPYPTNYDLLDVYFVSESLGWVVGIDGLIMRTTNGGQDWEIQHTNPEESFWSVFFIDEMEGWTCGWSKVYHTEDGGENWVQQNVPTGGWDNNEIYFINADTGWIAGSYKTILRTTDGGENWSVVHSGSGLVPLAKEIEFYDELNGCVVGECLLGEKDGYVLITEDGGLSWSDRTPPGAKGLSGAEYLDDYCLWVIGESSSPYFSCDGGLTWSEEFAVGGDYETIHFFNPDTVMLMVSHDVVLSHDGAATWDTIVPINYYYLAFNAFSSYDETSGYAVSYRGGICKTQDCGESWEQINQGLPIASYQLGFLNEYDGFSLHAGLFLLRTADGGYSWNWDTILPTSTYSCMYFGGESCYFLNDSLQLVFSHDAANSWEIVQVPEPETRYSDMHFINNELGFICGYHGELLKTTDGGLTWQDLQFAGGTNFSDIFSFDALHGWLIDYNGEKVFRTINGGESWIPAQIDIEGILQPIGVLFINETIGYIATEEGFLCKSTDGGENWDSVYRFNYLRNDLVFFNENQGFCTDASKVYHTYDGGNSWSDGIEFGGGCGIFSLFFLNQELGWLGGNKGLIARFDGSINLAEQVLNSDQLSVFPNPTTNAATIDFEILESSHVQLFVFNSSGQVIDVLLNHQLQPGKRSIKWNAHAHPKGIYFVVLKSEEGITTRKIVKL